MPNFSKLLGKFGSKQGGNVISQTIGFASGQAASIAILPEAQPIANAAWAASPSMPAPLEMAAAAALKTPAMEDTAREWAAQQGFGNAVFDAAKDATDVPPGIAELLTLYNRGELTDSAVIQGFRSGMVEERWLTVLLRLAETPLSPAEAATARQQGFITEADQKKFAAMAGVDDADAEIQFQIVGLPPGVGEALTMLRRNIIDEATFAQIVREGHTKTKYTDDLLALQYEPLSASVAAEALIRERMSEEDAVRIAAQNGIAKDDFLAWANMLGRPIPTGEALTLVNRGKMTLPEFREVVARSDVRTEYTDQLLELRVHYPSLFQITHAVQSGAIPDELALRTLKLEGFTDEWATAIVGAAHKTKTAATKNLSLSVIATLFDAGLEDEHDALEQIKSLGYDDEEAALYLELHEARRYVSEITRATNIVRGKYVNRVIDEGEARKLLDVLSLRDSTKTRLMTIWADEREANVKVLSASQIANAFKYLILTGPDAQQRLIHLGYSEKDAFIILELTTKGPLDPQFEVPHTAPLPTTTVPVPPLTAP